MATDSFILLDAAPGPEDPIGMLGACHRRLEARLDALERVVEVYEARDTDRYERAAAAIARIIHHMQGPAATHHLDEELSLFPRLSSANAEAAALIPVLEGAHETLDAAWRSILPALVRLKDGEAPTPELIAALKAGVTVLVDGYRRHIQDEERELFARAHHVLDAEAIAAMGAEMRDRRHQP